MFEMQYLPQYWVRNSSMHYASHVVEMAVNSMLQGRKQGSRKKGSLFPVTWSQILEKADYRDQYSG
jgi:hypothetical protein